MNYDTISQIKQWRIKHGVSQRQLATKAGFSRNTYASWENNHRKASHKVIWRLQNTIFAWGENDYINNTIYKQTEQSIIKPEQPKKKKSILHRIVVRCGISIWFILEKLHIIKK